MKTRLLLLASALLLSAEMAMAQDYSVPVSEKNEKMMEGKFKPTWESLRNYKVPEWFRNAKFGIWAHWGPRVCRGLRVTGWRVNCILKVQGLIIIM